MDNTFLKLSINDGDNLLHQQAASVSYQMAIGPQQSQKVFTLQTLPMKEEDNCDQAAKTAGFSFKAGVFADSYQTDKLEKLCRYIARPAISKQRLSQTDSGKVHCELKTPYKDGTTRVFFELLDFIGKLAVLVPPPMLLPLDFRLDDGIEELPEPFEDGEHDELRVF